MVPPRSTHRAALVFTDKGETKQLVIQRVIHASRKKKNRGPKSDDELIHLDAKVLRFLQIFAYTAKKVVCSG
jgi:hypothetical protein